MTTSPISYVFASRRRAFVRALLPAAMHRGSGAAIGKRSVDDLIL